MADDLRTTELRDLLGPVAAGDRAARDELLRRVAGNLERLTHKLLAAYPTVRRWEQTDDVVQNATLRLLRALEHVSPADPRQFFGLAAEQIRRELIDLARHYYGPHGLGANYASRGGWRGPGGRPRAWGGRGGGGRARGWPAPGPPPPAPTAGLLFVRASGLE